MQLPYIAPVFAAVSQLPLLSSSESLVSPNFVLTLDNSESMALNHLPETSRSFTINKGTRTESTVTIDMGGTHIMRMHPDDNLSIETHALLKSVFGNIPGTVGDSCATVYECQMRSSDVNTVYYNPAVQYLPWRVPAQPGTRMANASFSKAYYDPTDQTDLKWVDLSTIRKKFEAVWCTQPSDQSYCGDPVAKDFNPAVFYLLSNPGVSDPRLKTSYVKYDLITRTSEMPYSRFQYPNRLDCPQTGNCTLEQERQNFANWFTYHRARILFTKGAISEAFATLGSNFRLGWGATQFATTDNLVEGVSINGGPTEGVGEFSAAQQTKFLNWLQGTSLKGSTPLRFATAGVGRYFQRTDNGSPWRENPGSTTASGILGCRRGGHILTTDGYYNDDGGYAGDYAGSNYQVGEVDNISDADAQTAGITYRAAAPYKDDLNHNSLGDIAMRFWAYPLVSKNLFSNPNDEVHTVGDPATWLHLNQYMVGLGVNGTVDQKTVSTTMTTDQSWPLIPSEPNNTSLAKIDDMIHAAVNSRGLFFSASDGDSLKQAVATAINDKTSSKQEAGATSSGLTAITGDTVYAPEYNTNGWIGDVKAYTITAAGDLALAWKASDKVPGADTRNVISYGTGDTRGIAFKAENVAAFPGLGTTYQTAAFINYIKGAESDTGTTTGTFRQHKGKLPDFINSAPTLVQGNVDLNYGLVGLPSGGTTYSAFVAKKKARAPLLFVGGNGGMLHAFNASVGGANSGAEVFAYVPKAALPNLSLLAAQNYSHHLYVDGPLTETDAFITTPTIASADWTNVLIGTMGAGGKGIFAIDVTGTARTDGVAALGASNVLWEISDQSTNGGDLGYVTSNVQAGYVQDGGGWYAFIGNGHDSAHGRAALLVVDLSTGAIVKSFELPGADGIASPNGLSGVSLIRNSSGEVIGAYAGDLHGQVWRFEFSGSDPGAGALWKVGFGGKPLFVARSSSNAVQKISAAPAHFKIPSSWGTTGNLIAFGTGRLVDSTDVDDTSEQTFYAVQDETVGSTSNDTSPLMSANGGRNKLQQQTFLPKAPGNGLIQMSSNDVSLKGDTKKYGWYVDLNITSDVMPGTWTASMQHPKVIYQPQIVRNLVFFVATAPPDSSNKCSASTGDAFGFFLPLQSGGQLTNRTLDTDGDGDIDTDDNVGQGSYIGKAGGNVQLKNTAKEKIGTTVNVGEKPGGMDPPGFPPKDFDKCAAGGDGCGSQVISDRIWKRIVNTPF